MTSEIPESFEAREKLPLSPGEQAIFDRAELDVEPYNDKKRPLPDEIEWGVPGAESEQ